MNVEISNWYCRLGNNVIQLINAIRYALDNNYYFSSPDHPFFSKIEINPDKKSEEKSIKLLFYFDYKHLGLDDKSYLIAQKYLKPNLKNIKLAPKSDKDTLHIHIRSGDIFYDNIHEYYVQNPLSYFENAIKFYKKIVIITQDLKNPVTSYLKKINNVEVKVGRSLEEDISDFLSATNLCIGGVGSFIPAICLLSSNVENVHVSNIQHPMHKFNFSTKCSISHSLYQTSQCENGISIFKKNIDINRYMKKWKNSEEQRKLMITYTDAFNKNQIKEIIENISSKSSSMSSEQYSYITSLSANKKMLVFGCGRDSILWRSISSKVLFLEHNSNWIDKNYDDIIKIVYTSKMNETTKLLDEYINNNYQKLYVKEIVENPTINNESWDVILVDSPEGYDPNKNHGRIQSIFMAKMLAKENTEVLVHDINRHVEKKCCEVFNLKKIKQIGNLGHYKLK